MRKEQVFDYRMVGNPTDCLNDRDLSLQAKGLFFVMLSDDTTTIFTIKDLVASSNCGKRTVVSAIKELSAHNYLEVVKGDDNAI